MHSSIILDHCLPPDMMSMSENYTIHEKQSRETAQREKKKESFLKYFTKHEETGR